MVGVVVYVQDLQGIAELLHVVPALDSDELDIFVLMSRGLGQREIGEELGLSRDQVKRRIAAARKKAVAA